MGDVIYLKDNKDWSPDFIVSAKATSYGYDVSVEGFLGDDASLHEIYRRISPQLIVIANGLRSNAEDMQPSPQGKVILQATIYEDGTSDMHLVPLEDETQRKWLISAIGGIVNYIKGGGRKT